MSHKPAANPVLDGDDRARLSFLARASRTLLASVDYRQTLQQLSDLAVPELGDWCAVDMVEDGGGFARLAVTHPDPAKVRVANELWHRYPPRPADPTGLPNVMRTRQAEVVEDIPDALLVAAAQNEHHLSLIRQLGLKSYMVLPLISKDRVLGALTLVQAESSRRYRPADLPFAEEFARLATMAVDSALLFESKERARQRAEASEAEFRSFIEHLPELAWTALPDGHIDYYNARWYEYTGTTFEEMQGWGWEKVHDPTLLPDVVARWKHSLATGTPFEMEFTLRGKDGVPRWFLTRVAPSRDPNGKILRWFGTNTNIHEIKAAQRLSREVAEQSLEAQKMLLEMRVSKERAENRVAELESLLARR